MVQSQVFPFTDFGDTADQAAVLLVQLNCLVWVKSLILLASLRMQAVTAVARERVAP